MRFHFFWRAEFRIGRLVEVVAAVGFTVKINADAATS